MVLIALTQDHTAEPAQGTFRSAAGGVANLFTMSHYPIDAICQVCQQPIRAESFLRAFQHR